MLAENDLNNIVRIGNLSRECVGDAQFHDIMTVEMMGLFNSESAVFIEYAPSSGFSRLDRFASFGIDSCHTASYVDRYHHQDPCYQRLSLLEQHSPQVSVSTDQVIDSEQAYINSSYYQDFMRTTGVHRSLIFTLARQDQPIGIIGLHRNRRGRHYEKQDHLKVQLIAPYLTSAIMYRHKERNLQHQNLLSRYILKSSNVMGYLVFDQHLSCVDGGGEDTGILLGEGIATTGAAGYSCRQLLPLQLESLVKARFQSELHDDDQLLSGFDNLTGAPGVRLERIQDDQGSAFVLVLFLKGSTSMISDDRMSYYGLTARQKEVVRFVQMGFTNLQISGVLKISEKTVENHLTQIYAKTHTHNKTSLLRQLHV